MRYGVSGCGGGDYFTSHLKVNKNNSSGSEWGQFGMMMLGNVFDMAALVGVAALTKGGESGGADSKRSEYALAKQEYNEATATIEVLDQKIQEYSGKSMTEAEYNTKNGEIDGKIAQLETDFDAAQKVNHANLDAYKKYSNLETKCKENMAEYTKTEEAYKEVKGAKDPGSDEEGYVKTELGKNYDTAPDSVKAGKRKEFQNKKAEFVKKQQLEKTLEKLKRPLVDGHPAKPPAEQLGDISLLKEAANGDAQKSELTCEKYLKDKAGLEADKKQLAADYKSSKSNAAMLESLQKEKATAVLKQAKAEAKMKSLEQGDRDLANAQKDLKNDKALKNFYKSHATDKNGNVTGKRNFFQRLTGTGKYQSSTGEKLTGQQKADAKNARAANYNSANAAMAYDKQRIKDLS